MGFFDLAFTLVCIVYIESKGLPIGLMLYGKSFQEDVVLRAGYAFQQATDWHTRIPDLGWAEK